MTYPTNHVRLLKNPWKEEINSSKKNFNSFSQNYFPFFDCDIQGQPINVGMGRGTLYEHAPIPWVGTLNQMCL